LTDTTTDLVIRINGRRWRLLYAPGLREQYGVYGDCDAANKPRKAIRLDPDQTDEELLDTLLHEMGHVLWPDLNEGAVERIAGEFCAAVLALFEVRRRCTEREVGGE
jgi:hypothetical protein